MVTTTTAYKQTVSTRQGMLHDVLGGLAGGVVFGTMMQALGMIGMIGMLVGSESLAVAWALHLVISAVFGALVAPRVSGWGVGLGAGLVYGLVLWVAGPLLVMPAMMGMPVSTIDATALQSLVGHLVFGLVLGGVVVALFGRARLGPREELTTK
jgi:uncharacterized membrane protein YagU involved in acid resistance